MFDGRPVNTMPRDDFMGGVLEETVLALVRGLCE
jgi:hypothetical protein